MISWIATLGCTVLWNLPSVCSYQGDYLNPGPQAESCLYVRPMVVVLYYHFALIFQTTGKHQTRAQQLWRQVCFWDVLGIARISCEYKRLTYLCTTDSTAIQGISQALIVIRVNCISKFDTSRDIKHSITVVADHWDSMPVLRDDIPLDSLSTI